MKRLFILVLVMALLVSLFIGCGTSQESSQATTEESAQSEDTQTTEAAETEEVDYSNIKIGMLLVRTTTDGGWCQAMYEGLMRSVEQLGLTEDQYVVVGELPEGGAEADSTIVQMVDDGCNIIFGTSAGNTVNMTAAYPNYPDVTFVQFEGGEGAANYGSFTCWDMDAIFMCGYAAALMSEVDDLGFVAPQPTASVIRAINSWSAGAKAANANATVHVLWANSWFDPAAEKECANSLIDDLGVQAIGFHGSSTAIPRVAFEAGIYCTGFHIDMHDYAPDAMLTSFMWNWTPIFNEIITEVATGSFNSDLRYMGMAEGAASIAPWNTDIMPQDVIDQCDAMYESIINGEYVVMCGPLYDNEGNQILAEGETFDVEGMTDMFFLLDNVVGDVP